MLQRNPILLHFVKYFSEISITRIAKESCCGEIHVVQGKTHDGKESLLNRIAYDHLGNYSDKPLSDTVLNPATNCCKLHSTLAGKSEISKL